MGHPCFQGQPSSDPVLTPHGGMGTPRGRTEKWRTATLSQITSAQGLAATQQVPAAGPEPESPPISKPQAGGPSPLSCQREDSGSERQHLAAPWTAFPASPRHLCGPQSCISGTCSHLLSALWGQQGQPTRKGPMTALWPWSGGEQHDMGEGSRVTSYTQQGSWAGHWSSLTCQAGTELGAQGSAFRGEAVSEADTSL